MESIICAGCGFSNEASAESCGNCGAAITGSRADLIAPAPEGSEVKRRLIFPLAVLVAACVGIFLITMSRESSWDAAFYSLIGRGGWQFYWAALGLLVIVASVPLGLNRDREIAIVCYTSAVSLAIMMYVLSITFEGTDYSEEFALCAFLFLAIGVVAALIRFLPSSVIAAILILAGIAFPLWLWQLIYPNGSFWRRYTTLRFLAGLSVAVAGVAIILFRDKSRRQRSKQFVRRKAVWIPAASLGVLMIAWPMAVRPMFAHSPVDGEWEGKGEGDITGLTFKVENGKISALTLMLKGKGGVMFTALIIGSPNCKTGSGTFVCEGGASTGNSEQIIEGVFDSATQASGEVNITTVETIRNHYDPLGSRTTLTYSGKWTAQPKSPNP